MRSPRLTTSQQMAITPRVCGPSSRVRTTVTTNVVPCWMIWSKTPQRTPTATREVRGAELEVGSSRSDWTTVTVSSDHLERVVDTDDGRGGPGVRHEDAGPGLGREPLEDVRRLERRPDGRVRPGRGVEPVGPLQRARIQVPRDLEVQGQVARRRIGELHLTDRGRHVRLLEEGRDEDPRRVGPVLDLELQVVVLVRPEVHRLLLEARGQAARRVDDPRLLREVAPAGVEVDLERVVLVV